MLAPKRVKYRFRMKGRIAGPTPSGASLEFGEYGLKSLKAGLLSEAQLEAARKAIMHATKRSGKLWLRVFPDKPITGKAAGIRMGGGKGDIKHYSAVIRAGKVIFELSGVPREVAKLAFYKATQKIPLPTRVVYADKTL